MTIFMGPSTPTRKSVYFIAVIVASVALFWCNRHAVAADKEKSSEVNFRARTELVLIPVLVTDKSGTHVPGMKKEDFAVFENGSERKIATFEEINSDPHVSRPANTNEFTNSVGVGSTRRVTLIVLDFVNTPFFDQVFVRNQLLKYLAQSLNRHEPTGLFILNRSGIHVIHEFATDPGVLIAALHKVRGDASSQLVDTPEEMEALTGSASPEGSSGDIATAGKTEGSRPGSAASIGNMVQQEASRLQSMIEDAALNFQSFQQQVAIACTLEGMQQLAQSLVGLPGRKALIWAGGGFPFRVSDTTMQLAPAGRESLTDVLPLYERTWQLLNDAQIALYPVDVKGMQSNMPSASIRMPSLPNRKPSGYMRRIGWQQVDTQSTFEIFAAATGGRAYYNSNDLVKGFDDAIHDSAQYYVVGYYLDKSNEKTGWRKLTVNVKREHVNVRSRSGVYVTGPALDSLSIRNNEHEDIASALQSPLEYTALILNGHWEPAEPSKDPSRKRMIYIVNLAPDAVLMDTSNKNHISMELAALATRPDGLEADRSIDNKIDLHPTTELLGRIREKGIGCRGALELPPGEYTVRIVVLDDLSGRIGSVTTALKVE
jgi:VWFA-related protein